jgi:hypothetical protein
MLEILLHLVCLKKGLILFALMFSPILFTQVMMAGQPGAPAAPSNNANDHVVVMFFLFI